MDQEKKILLLGLKKYGRKKTFKQILALEGVELDDIQRVQLANELEESGVIQSVTYKLPVEIRAELSERGKDLLKKPSKGNSAIQMLLVILNLGQITVPA